MTIFAGGKPDLTTNGVELVAGKRGDGGAAMVTALMLSKSISTGPTLFEILLGGVLLLRNLVVAFHDKDTKAREYHRISG